MINRILDLFRMRGYNDVMNTLPDGLELSTKGGNVLEEITPYRKLVGALMQISNMVRPEITFEVNYIARLMNLPTNKFWTAGKHVLSYLKGAKQLGIVFVQGEVGKISVYSDAYCEQERPSRKSISDYVFICSGGPISWSSKQQKIVAQSFMEAEYTSSEFFIRETLWLKNFGTIFKNTFNEHDLVCMFNIKIGESNMGCLRHEHNPVVSELSKHVDIKYQFPHRTR